jgi:hypothetical protein
VVVTDDAGLGTRLRRSIPPQHGAWAFLGLPLVLGALVSPASWTLLPLTVTWIAAYPWSYAALGLARSRRRDRFRDALTLWSWVLVPAAVLLLVLRPWLVWVGLGYLLLFLVNVGFARRHDERDLRNDAVFIVECALMVPVTWGVAAGTTGLLPPAPASMPTQVWVLTAVVALVLLGSTLHVKSLIRERRDPRYARASRRFAWGSLAAAPGLALWWGLPSGWWLVPPFVVLAVRAVAVPRRAWRPGVIGMVELAAFVLVAVAVAVAA